MDAASFLEDKNRALQYAKIISDSLLALSDGAIVHERNRLVSNIEFAVATLLRSVPQNPESDDWFTEEKAYTTAVRVLNVWAAADRAMGWMVRISTPSVLLEVQKT
jgi:hypothetical protein